MSEYVAEVTPPHGDYRQESIMMLKDGFGHMKENNCVAKTKLVDSTLGEIGKVLGNEGVDVGHREGTAESGWVLLDYGSVIVHVFDPNTRHYYNLEQLWSKSKPVIRIQ